MAFNWKQVYAEKLGTSSKLLRYWDELTEAEQADAHANGLVQTGEEPGQYIYRLTTGGGVRSITSLDRRDSKRKDY